VVYEYFDAEGNILQSFEPRVLRTLVRPTDGSLPVLTPYEDMLIHGEESLSCRCVEDSETYDEAVCAEMLQGYEAQYQLDVNADTDAEEWETITYTVNTSDSRYIIDETVCNPDLADPDYQPPFIDSENIQIVQEGMRMVVTQGTGTAAALPYVTVAGKTGTAEYCDDIARNLGLCKQGEWPAHAWFVGYAPWEDPEIIVVGFFYNGGEGSAVALPAVAEVLDAYFNIKVQRANPDLQQPEAETETTEEAPAP
jgi:membrane carboxypeptidase/penicillin-binding protein